MFRAHTPRVPVGLAILLVTVLLVLPLHAQAQEKQPLGVIKGTVLDGATQQPLPYTNVLFLKVTDEFPDGASSGGAMGMADGTFEGKVLPGTYIVEFQFIGYTKVRKDDIVVGPGKTVVVNATLEEAEAMQVEVVEVQAEAVREATGAMITLMRKEAGVNEAVTSESIAKTGDSNAADALTRVTGVSVVGGKYVYIRGLGDRYSSTQVNGSAVGTPETNKRVVPLDLFPSSVLENIIVQKTFTPDMDGEFGGGVVKINTSDFSGEGSFRQSASVGARADDGFLTYNGGSWDFLGFDDGARDLPDEVAEYEGRVGSQVPLEERRELTKGFAKTWAPQASDLPTTWSYAGVYNRGLNLLGKRGGVMIGGSLSNDFNTLDKVENDWESGNVRSAYDVQESRREVLAGINANYTMELDEYNKDKLKLSFLGTKNTTDLVKVSGGVNNDFGEDYIERSDLAYLERSVTQTVLQGNHTVLGKNLLDWNLGYSTAAKDEPDRRFYTYQLESDSLLYLGGRSQYPLQRLYGEGMSYTRSGKIDFTVPLGVSRDNVSKLKLGYAYLNKDQDSQYRRFGFTCVRGGNCGEDRTQNPNDLILGEEGAVNYVMEELTQDADGWSGSQDLGAGYMMVDASLNSWLRVIAGSRYEESTQRVVTSSPYSIFDKNIEASNADTRWFPSLNAIISVGEDANLRAAWSQTVNRPELRELSTQEYYDWDKGWNVQGNENLSTAFLESWDLRGEYYPGPGEMVALSVFYKDFDQPIQGFMKTLSTGYAELPVNGESGWLRGTEGEVRLNFHSAYRVLDWLVDLGGKTPSHKLRRWGLLANFSIIDSEVEIDFNKVRGIPPGSTIDLGRGTYDFTGQSDYSVNWGLFFQLERLEANLVYKSFGPRLMLISESQNLKGLTEDPAAQLDFLFSYQLSDITKVKLGAKNLLDEATAYNLGTGELSREYSQGRTFSVGISYTP